MRFQKKMVGILGGGLLIVGIICWVFIHHGSPRAKSWEQVLGTQNEQKSLSTPIPLSETSKTLASTPKGVSTTIAYSVIMADVKGAVQRPGVYKLSADSRIKDVIQLAGGFLPEADSTKINLAQHVKDEMVIYVPKKGEQVSENSLGLTSSFNSSSQTSLPGVVHLNTATESDLESLPGIGPSKAKAIFDYRVKNGPFQSVDDLVNVTGIGDKLIERMKPYIQLK